MGDTMQKRFMKLSWMIMLAVIYFWSFSYQSVYAMHILEGFLPIKWTIFWWAITIPFLIKGLRTIQQKLSASPELKTMLGVSTAFTFVLSALKLPSVTGSSSHPTGVGLGTILFGPTVMTVIGFIVLFFQAMLLAHGGITTLGANAFAMGVVGPFATYFLFKFLRNLKVNFKLAIFTSTAIGNLSTYVMTSFQLALAFPDRTSGIIGSFSKFIAIFGITQLPLAITEGILTVMTLNYLLKYNSRELTLLSFREADSR